MPKLLKGNPISKRPLPLFVFLIVGPKQNAGSLLTPVSETVYVLSYGTLGFALHGSSFNHFLIGGNSLTANQILRNSLLKLPCKAKSRIPCERA